MKLISKLQEKYTSTAKSIKVPYRIIKSLAIASTIEEQPKVLNNNL